MLNLKQISLFNWMRGFTVIVLVALLLPTRTASAEASVQDSSPYEKQMPANGVRSRISTSHANFMSFSGGTNFVQDPSFEASYGSNAYWEQYSTNFGTPLCITADCTDGGGTAGPRTGSVWGWLGGTQEDEVSDLYQYVTFPSCGATLQFYLWIGYADPGSDANDFFGAAIDGNVVFSANATQKNSYPAYTLISVDVSAYANGGTHVVEFFSVTTGQAVTFNLDDVALIGNCSISGNAGVAGATLSYTDGTLKTVTSSGDGSYSLPVSYNWSGTVTPSHPCYTFSPSSRSHSNVIANQTSQNFTATFNAGSGCANINVTIAGADHGDFGILPGASTRASFSGIDNGPVKVSSTNSMNILAALRVIWKEPGFRASYSEMMGLPGEQLSSEYWFPWYNNASTNSMDQGFRIANLDSASNTVAIYIGGAPLDSINLSAGQSVRVGYMVDNGPIRILCTTCSNTGTDRIIAALRVIWKEPGKRYSYSEMMGLPVEQLSSEYWFPWYNNAATASMDQGFRIANVSATESNTVEVWVGSTKLDTITLSAGASRRVGYNVDNGPIRILCTTCSNTGDDKIIAALRVIWQEPGFRASYSEMMGLPTEQLSSEYWFPWYNNVDTTSMDQGFRIANVDTTSHTVKVFVGAVQVGMDISLGAGASTRVGYTVNNGPIRIVCIDCTSSQKIIAALRVIWKEPGFRASYSEMMGLPKEALSTEYWFPWYNNAAVNSMDQGFRIAVP